MGIHSNCLLTCTLLITMAHDLSAQTTQAWAVRFDPPVAQSAADVAVDDSGNVYVAGSSATNVWGTLLQCTTTRFDSMGNLVWRAFHDNLAPAAIALDAAGNLYVTGWTDVGGLNCLTGDCETFKYDRDGNELWSATYAGPAQLDDGPTGIAVDSSGNVLITGYTDAWCGSTWGSSATSDSVTIKYSPAGTQLWVARYHLGTSHTIAVDSADDVYVTGEVLSWSNGYTVSNGDFLSIKYDASGNTLWRARYAGPAGGRDVASDLALDSAGNVYVTGASESLAGSADYATIKYDTLGNELWTQRYDGPSGGIDEPAALAADGAGGVYVTGTSASLSGTPDITTVRYDASGSAMWVARFDGQANGADSAADLTVDITGNVIVAGSTTTAVGSTDFITLAYDASGNLLWSEMYDGPPSGEDRASALAVDPARNAYVTGSSVGVTTSSDILTIKYVQGPTAYCTASTTTHGCSASMAASGTPSAAATSGFALSCQNTEGQVSGMIIYGVSGRTLVPWSPSSTSVLCIEAPRQRTSLQLSGGASGACDGSFAFDFLAYMSANPLALGQPLASGEHFDAQCWFRDPAAPHHSNLSNAIAFDLVP